MRRTALSVLILVFLMGIFAFAATAEEVAVSADTEATAAAETAGEPAEFDFLAFAKERVLTDFHPTVKVEDAEANYDEEPFSKGDGITRARVGIFYKGWIRQHSMLIEMDYREDRKVRVTVLKDSNGHNLQGARFFKEGEWVSLAAVGWK